MQTHNVKQIYDAALELGCPMVMMNEAGAILNLRDEASYTVLDVPNEIFVSIRTNRNYATVNKEGKPFQVQHIECDSIKTCEMELSYDQLRQYLDMRGIEFTDEIKKFLDNTAQIYSHYPSNYTKKYKVTKTDDGEEIKTEEIPYTPSIEV